MGRSVDIDESNFWELLLGLSGLLVLSILGLIAPLEPLDSTGRVHHAAFARQEWMALAAKLNLDYFLC